MASTIHKLIIEDDEGKTTVVPLSRGEITIGRMEGNTIRLMERNVSRRHARLVRDNGTIFIEDLNSFNGVKINGDRIDRRLEIKEGDLVEIGDYHLALQALEIEEEPSPPARPDTVLSSAPTELPGANGDRAWPGTLPGTVPDLRLPDQLLMEAREALKNGGGAVHPQETTRELQSTAQLRPQSPSATVPSMTAPGGFSASPQAQLRGPSVPPFPPFPASGPTAGPSASPLVAPSLAEGSFPVARTREEQRTEQIQVGPARLAEVARLVCVSTEYAGRDFALTRPEVIIGRVEDNDVVIEHRSVSRNHAKILFDGRVHKIIDLESANGILVNGEEYAITDLRKGDLIELGHVRFRFIPAGEPFVPTDEETQAMLAAGVAPPSPPKPFEAPSLPPKAETVRSTTPKESDRTEELGAGTVEIAGPADPSTAATVTDTPIDVLGVASSQLPKLEQPTERPHHSPPSRREVVEQTIRTPVRVGGAAEVRRARDPAADDESRSGGKSSRAMVFVGIALVVLLLASLVAVFVAFSGGGAAPSADQELRALFDRGDYEGVKAFFYQNVKGFADAEKAATLVKEAEKRGKAIAALPPPEVERPAEAAGAPPAPEVAEPAGATGHTEELPPGEEDSPPVEDSPSPAAKGEEHGRRKVTKATPASKRGGADRAKSLEREGLKAFWDGKNPLAEDLYKECIRQADYPPSCHRQLAVLYARTERSRLACKHYEQYVRLAPTAPDAETVRGIIAQNCGK